MQRCNNSEFTKLVVGFMTECGWKLRSEADLVEDWSEFVDVCEGGYAYGMGEYDHDLRCRERVQWILEQDFVPGSQENIAFRREILGIDQRFLALGLEGVVRSGRVWWWERLILRRAGPEYADDVLRAYGVRIQITD